MNHRNGEEDTKRGNRGGGMKEFAKEGGNPSLSAADGNPSLFSRTVAR